MLNFVVRVSVIYVNVSRKCFCARKEKMFYVSSFLEVLIVAGEHIVYSLAAEIFEHCLD